MAETVVLLGGESEEREISIQSGTNIAEALKTAGIEADTYDWDPSKMLDFLSKGYRKVFIALHGGSGENGTVQAMLDLAGIAYTGVRMRAASICMDKLLSKTIVSKRTSVPVPGCVPMPVSDARATLAQEGHSWQWLVDYVGLPMIVKPSRNGSSVGVTLVESVDDMDEAVRAACLADDEIVMFEQYIRGHELTVAVLNGNALGVCEIIPKNKFYDYDAKYNRDDTEYLTPSSLGEVFDLELCARAEKVVRALDCTTGVVRVDFLADLSLESYFLEVNTVPGMTAHSLVPKIAKYAGYEFPELCEMILDMAH